ncbi:MAG TPA: ABC transporter ATP-binding protein [Candidatus Baltobacteraceae bacterium]|nr:ABC transporter ATP-binding protein [Candidatus Baltobacteraceae bacterium]
MPGPDGRGILIAGGITKRFGPFTAVDAVDLTLRADEALGIVGPNGAGKTTLINVLAGAYPPSTGAVEFDGGDVSALDAASRCRLGIARTHQVPRPFTHMTVFENVLVAALMGGHDARSDAYERSIEALRLCGMLRLGNRRAEALGLLDRKRLELARALATRPKVLLLDEIGGGLTDAEASELVAIVRELRRRAIAIVWIEHILHVLLQVVERLVCMDAGRVIADDVPDAVLAHPAVIEAYLGSGVT